MILGPDSRPLDQTAETPQRTVEIVRSFAYKVNLENHGGPRYESVDLFASQKVFCTDSERAEASEAAYQFCRAEVLRATREIINAIKQKGRTAA